MDMRSEERLERLPSCRPLDLRQAALASLRARLACVLSLGVLLFALMSLSTPTSTPSGFVAGGVGTAYAQETPKKKTKSFLDTVKDGGWIGGVIIICSIIGVSLSLMYAFQIRRDAMVPPELLEHVEQLFEDEEYEEAFHVCEANPSFLSSILTGGLAKIEEGFDEMQTSMQETGEVETAKLHQKIGYISLIAAIAPMLGLFGTVSGMIATFNVIASSDVQPKPADLAGGISQALVTTFMGLLVAIPMTVIYAVYRNRIAAAVVEVGEIAEELMGRFKAPAE